MTENIPKNGISYNEPILYKTVTQHFRNNLYVKNYWELGDEDFILIKVGGAKMHSAIDHDYRTCQVFPLRYNCLRCAQQIVTVGRKNLNFGSRMRIVIRIIRYKRESKNVSSVQSTSVEDRQTHL